jgi:hypothetical protein
MAQDVYENVSDGPLRTLTVRLLWQRVPSDIHFGLELIDMVWSGSLVHLLGE